MPFTTKARDPQSSGGDAPPTIYAVLNYKPRLLLRTPRHFQGGRAPHHGVDPGLRTSGLNGLPCGRAGVRFGSGLAELPVQPHHQFASDRHLGNRFAATEHQALILPSQLRVHSRCGLRRWQQQKPQQRISLLADRAEPLLASLGFHPTVLTSLRLLAKRSTGPTSSTKASDVTGPTPACRSSRTAAGRCSAPFRRALVFRHYQVYSVGGADVVIPSRRKPWGRNATSRLEHFSCYCRS